MKTKKVRFQLRWVPARSPMSCDMWQVYYGIDLICLFLLFRENRNTRVVQVTHDCDCYYHVYLQQSIVIFMSELYIIPFIRISKGTRYSGTPCTYHCFCTLYNDTLYHKFNLLLLNYGYVLQLYRISLASILSTSKMLAILFLLYLRLAIKFSAHRLKTGVYACLQSVAVWSG